MHKRTSNRKLAAISTFLFILMLFSANHIHGTILSEYSCNFTVDFCSWKQGWQHGNFTRCNRATRTPDTGPDTGHTQRPHGQYYDYYIYIESDIDKAELLGPPLGKDCRDYCFRFWYHMYGAYINKAEVGVTDNVSPLWIKEGNQNNSWQCGFVALENNICRGKQVYVRAYGKEGALQTDIAFDDLALLKDVPCNATVCNIIGEATTQRVITTDGVGDVIPSGSTIISKDQDTPISTKDNSTRTSPYIYLSLLALPIIVLVAGIMFVCFRKNKEKQRNDSRDPRDSVDARYIRDPTGNVEEEVYDTIEEIPVDGGYLTPSETDNGYIDALSVSGPYASHTANDDYLFPTSMDSAGSIGSLSYLHRNLDRQALGNDYLSPTSIAPARSATNESSRESRNLDKRINSENHPCRDSQNSFDDYDQASGFKKPDLPKRPDPNKLVSQNQDFNDYENPVSKSMAMVNRNVEIPPPDYVNSDKNIHDRNSSTSL